MESCWHDLCVLSVATLPFNGLNALMPANAPTHWQARSQCDAIDFQHVPLLVSARQQKKRKGDVNNLHVVYTSTP